MIDFQPPITEPMIGKDGMITVPWALFFTKLIRHLNQPGLNFSYVAPDLRWTDPNNNPHVIASAT